MKKERLVLDNILQFRVDLDYGKKQKVDYLVKLQESSQITQCIIFVNTRAFAITVHKILKQRGLKANVIFGKGMEDDERQKVVQKFREGSITFLITTDLLARGFDVRSVKLVINFDVPTHFMKDRSVKGDAETYLHRIGRGGRFGTKAIAVTLIDREDDKTAMDQIVAHFAMADKVHQLTDPATVGKYLEKYYEEENEDN